jgi:predicted nucleotidyltransferase
MSLPALVPRQLEDFKIQLEKHFGDRFSGLTLFGSYASKQARQDSDLDLLLVLKNSSGEDDYQGLLPLLSGFLLETGVLVSLLIKSEKDLSFQKEGVLKIIQTEGIRL